MEPSPSDIHPIRALTQFFVEQGFTVPPTPTSLCVNNEEVLCWSEAIFDACRDLTQKVDSFRQLLFDAEAKSAANDISVDSLNRKLESLSNSVSKHSSTETAMASKLAALELSSGRDIEVLQKKFLDEKKKCRSFEILIQEYDRRQRKRDAEFERLQARVKVLTEKSIDKSNRTPKSLRVGVNCNDSALSIDNHTLNTSATSPPSVVSRNLQQGKIDKLMSVIDGLHSNRRELIERNAELELQLKDLLVSYKESLSEDKNLPLSPPDALPIEQSIVKPDREEIRQLSRKVKALTQVNNEQQNDISNLLRINSGLQDEVNQLKESLRSCPSAKEWNTMQHVLKEKESQIADLILLRSEDAEMTQWKNHLPAKERIRIDKRNHELGLWIISSLPKSTLVESMQAICRELDSSDIHELLPTIEKLKSVVRTVPRMERFISRTVSFVNDNDKVLRKKMGNSVTYSEQSMEQTAIILQRWCSMCDRCISLEAINKSYLFEIFRGQQLIASPNVDARQIEENWNEFGQQDLLLRPNSSVLASLRSAIDFQADLLTNKSCLDAVDNLVHNRPDLVVHQLILHAMYLFEIRSMKEFAPTLDRLFQFTEKVKNFLATASSAMQLEMGANMDFIFEKLLQLPTGRSKSDRDHL